MSLVEEAKKAIEQSNLVQKDIDRHYFVKKAQALALIAIAESIQSISSK